MTYSSPTSQTYIAYISSNSTSYPPPNIQATSNYQPVTWFSISLSAARLYPNTTVSDTLTATTNGDVGPTPYWIEIFDTTTSTFEADCSSGTSCSASVTSSTAATHNFVAYVSSYGTTYPPSNIQATSSTVSVTWVTLTLTASVSSGSYVGVGTSVTMTANISTDVGPTPYYLQIYANNSQVWSCGSGTSCQTNVSYSTGTSETFIAALGSWSSTYPPAGFQAQSLTVQVTWVSVSISAYPTRLTPNAYTTVTATSSTDVGPTPYYIEIFVTDYGAQIGTCGSGTSCSVNFSTNNPATDHFQAYIAPYDSNGTYPPPGEITASGTVAVTWQVPPAGTGVYGFESRAQADTALNEGWPGLGPVDGHCSNTFDQYPYTCNTGAAANVQASLDAHNVVAFWLSFWTVSGATGSDSWYTDGHDAGSFAASQIDQLTGHNRPQYLILDPEGLGSTNATTQQNWYDWINGWVAGIQSVDPNLTGAFYANQAQMAAFNLQGLNVKAFVAVTPIQGNRPVVTGGNVEGYDAYYAVCSPTTGNDSADVSTVNSWGAMYNTVQFQDSGVDCAP